MNDTLSRYMRVGNPQVTSWLLVSMDRNGFIFRSQDEIAKDIGVSRKTVNRTFMELLSSRLLVKIPACDAYCEGKYLLNPHLLNELSSHRLGLEKRLKIFNYHAGGKEWLAGEY